ncbi:MAG TPA: PQQ-dependent sugar dehydrogenase [Candidatus Saccharimonadaceae bacterium]|jgi:glucose/arabinose dehydrogenase|nr:PQQ-dependent sugar dehydrogenase [Candidatus Saccharimonadaceae bacterium]
MVKAALFVVLLAAAPAGARGAYAPATGLALQPVARDLDRPLALCSPPGDPRLFITEQPGRIRIVEGGKLLAAPFLDIRSRVRSGGEQGLLSVAFHPDYAKNGFFYVDYTDVNGDTRIERYHVSSDPDRADPNSAVLLLHIDQPYANHNGGLVLFGLDRMLYVGMGDGGSGGDPHGNGQNLGSRLGKLLRLDVDHGDPYVVPADNPFARRAGAAPEIWAYGLRNPWRYSFDAPSGLLYIADVGQNKWEEIDAVPARSAGLNFGWNRMEGAHDFKGRGPVAGLTRPIEEYGHDEGCSITGGFVYRGRALPALVGCYVFADYCSGWVRSLRYANGRVSDRREWLHAGPVSSFGVDSSGELYVVTLDGNVGRLVASR